MKNMIQLSLCIFLFFTFSLHANENNNDEIYKGHFIAHYDLVCDSQLSITNELNISFNETLFACTVPAICNKINTDPSNVSLFNNAGLCFDLAALNLACSQIVECPSFIFPTDGATDIDPNADLEWEAVDGATGYIVRLGTTSGGTETVDDLADFNFYELPPLFDNTIYYLTIIPFNDLGEATGCLESTFSVGGGTTPDCTSLIEPMIGETNVNINANLTWDSSLNAWGYQVIVGTTSGGTDIVNNEDVMNVTNYTLPQLNYATTYYVTIISYNEFGFAVGCPEMTFSTVPLPVPACTNLIDPINGSMQISLNSDITWEPILNADGYFLTVGTTSGGVELINNVDVGNVSTYDIGTMANETIYYVIITPYNSFGSAMTCQVESFSTESNMTPPGCTMITFPENGAIDLPSSTTISWDPLAAADGYRVRIGTAPGGSNIVGNEDVGPSTTWNAFPLALDFTYYVTITPYNINGSMANCPEISFSTATTGSTIECTMLSNPQNGATNVSIASTINWNPVMDATGYLLHIGSVPGVNDFINGLDVGNVTSYSLGQLGYDFQYYVTVVPYGEVGPVIGCVEESFITESFPSQITLNCPGNLVFQTTVGGTSAIVNWDEPTATTNCPGGLSPNGVVQISGPTSGSELQIGDQTVVYEIMDECGDFTSCTFIVIVEANPLTFDVTCPENQILNTSNETGMIVNFDQPNVIHNCGAQVETTVQSQGIGSGQLFPVGTTLIEYEVTLECNGATYTEICSFAITIKFSPDTSDCPDDIPGFTVLGEYNNHKYYISNNTETWTNASATAAMNDAYIVSINDADENEFIRSNLGNNIVFIGLNDVTNEGAYEWDSGEAVGYEFIETQPTTGEQDFANMNFWSGGWAFDNQYVQRRYIIESNCGPVQTELNVNCPSNLSVNIPSSQTSVALNYDLPTYTASCAGEENVTVTLISGPENGDVFNVGITDVVYEITLTCGAELISQQCTFMVTVNQVDEPDCAEEIIGFSFLGTYNDHNYFLSDNSLSWLNASSTAMQNNGYLVSMNDAAENEFVRSVIGNNIVFIGLNDEQADGNYQWDSGEAFGYNFIETQPVNGDQDFANMNFWSGGWAFDNHYVQRRFVIELECGPTSPSIMLTCAGDQIYQANPDETSSPVNWTAPFATTSCTGGVINVVQTAGPQQSSVFQVNETIAVTYEITDNCGNTATCSFTVTLEAGGSAGECPEEVAGYSFMGAFNGHHYFLSNSANTWSNAQAEAASLGGYLVSITTQEETEFLRSNINQIVMTGLTDQNTEGVFEWDSGEPFEYSFITDGNAGDRDFGTINFWNGGWGTVNQWVQKPYIIEFSCGASSPQPNLNSVGGNKMEIQGMYPNPANNYMYIEIKSSYNNTTTIKVIDALGMTKLELPIELAVGVSKIRVDMNQLKEGLYFIQLSGHGSNAANSKFLKLNSGFGF